MSDKESTERDSRLICSALIHALPEGVRDHLTEIERAIRSAYLKGVSDGIHRTVHAQLRGMKGEKLEPRMKSDPASAETTGYASLMSRAMRSDYAIEIPSGRKRKFLTCAKCGARAVAFACMEPGCPMNGVAEYVVCGND